MALILPDLCNRSQKCEFLIQNPSESYMLATDLETSKDTLGAKQTCLCAYMACPLPAASRKPGLRDSCSLCPLDSPSFLGKAHATPCIGFAVDTLCWKMCLQGRQSPRRVTCVQGPGVCPGSAAHSSPSHCHPHPRPGWGRIRWGRSSV